jgi:hypothetical protein
LVQHFTGLQDYTIAQYWEGGDGDASDGDGFVFWLSGEA